MATGPRDRPAGGVHARGLAPRDRPYPRGRSRQRAVLVPEGQPRVPRPGGRPGGDRRRPPGGAAPPLLAAGLDLPEIWIADDEACRVYLEVCVEPAARAL